MKRELIIDKYGLGNAVVVLDRGKVIDLFIDPPSNANFYPPNTFIEAKIQRKLPNRGGYFVKLPNSSQGFLKSKSIYQEGESVTLLSKVFFDEEKPQIFTDKLKIISKYFILKLGDKGFSFSKKISKNLNKDLFIPILEAQIKDQDDIFVICRSQIADLSIESFIAELIGVLQHWKLIKDHLFLKKRYYDGLAKKVALDTYDVEHHNVIEEEGIFERLGLWDEIDLLCKKKYLILDGPNLILEQTSSFLAIDVNSGKDLKIDSKELNFLASKEICRLIKILGLGGKIIIDFLPCSKLVKREIRELIMVFLDNNATDKIWGWTNGGAFELERKRDKTPLKLLLQRN